MKYVVRNGIWESNSSSAHSIVVTKDKRKVDPSKLVWNTNDDYDRMDCVYLENKGKLRLWDIYEGYGRYPFRLLMSFEDKLKYAMCEYLGYLYEDDPEWDKWYKEFESIAYEMIPGFKGFDIDTKEEDLYLDQDGNDIMHKDLIYSGWDRKNNRAEYCYIDKNGKEHPAIFNEEEYMEMPNIGTIDHQSAGMLKNFIKDKGITLRDFLINKKYIVVVAGDEYDDFPQLLGSGLINTDFIMEIYDKSGEDVEYEEWLKENRDEES